MNRMLAPLTVLFSVLLLFINNCSNNVTGSFDIFDPRVSITSPAEDSVFVEGATISFSGRGKDYEGTVLPDSMLVWISDQDDTIGTGTSFERDDLSINTHLITLIGTDREGKSESSNITIHVESFLQFHDLVSVPATEGYLMGWEGITPVRTVSVDAFQIGKYEVTRGRWIEVADWGNEHGYSSLSYFHLEDIPTDRHPAIYLDWICCMHWCNAYSEKAGLKPVYYTDWELTNVVRCYWPMYIYMDRSANGFRLPKEAEWEYAARYIDGTNLSSGAEHSGHNLYPNIEDCAWYKDNSEAVTHPVGELNPNSLGIYDMSGNAFEWCWDVYSESAYPSVFRDDPSVPAIVTMHSLRGGAYNVGSTGCRTAYNEGWYLDFPLPSTGLRICRSNFDQ